ncbi:MAG: site-specific integrase [Patescibacteria group bacterium]
MKATANIYFDGRASRRNKDGLRPVKLCITYNRDQKYYSIVDQLCNNEWRYIKDDDIKKVYPINEKTKEPKNPIGIYKDIRIEYERIVKNAEGIIKDIDDKTESFSFNQFEERFYNKAGSWDNVFTAVWNHIQDLKSEGRFGYASSFESTLRTIKEFHIGKSFDFNPRKDKVETRSKAYLTGKELRFIDITDTWLKKFERWMQQKGKSKSTIGIYVRNIRRLFNLAIDDHKVKANYPFTEHKIKSASGRKMALTAHQISLIANYETKHPQEQFYRDIFMFSFLGNGMNLSDVARLRHSNIKDEEICFVREKTKNKDHEVTLQVPITKNMQVIISRHENKTIGYDAYIFPILKEDWANDQKYAAIKQLTKQVNKYIRHVAHAVGIKDNISSYTARHSWATISKNSGTSIEYIKEALGHSSVAVTENYLKSFEKSTRQEHSTKTEDSIYKQNAV